MDSIEQLQPPGDSTSGGEAVLRCLLWALAAAVCLHDRARGVWGARLLTTVGALILLGAHASADPKLAIGAGAETEAKKVLKEVLAASRLEGYLITSRNEMNESAGLKPFMLAFWRTRDEKTPILGWLGIVLPEQGIDAEQFAEWVSVGESKSCVDLKGRFIQDPLRFIRGGIRMTTACEYQGNRDGGYYTFISRKDGGLYLFTTLPAVENGLGAAGSAHDKLSDGAIRILGPQIGHSTRRD